MISPFHCQLAGRDYLVRELGKHDQAEVLRLFERAFQQQATAAWHDWKYQQGQGQAVGLLDEKGQLLAHYAGFPRTLLWQSKPLPAIQIGDVMVDPSVRGLLTRRGPFYQVCHAFVRSRLGQEGAFQLAFGFPNERALKLGKAIGIYHNSGPICQLVWHLKRQNKNSGWKVQRINKAEEVLDMGKKLWPIMQKGSTDWVMGIRGGSYLEHRYLQRPDQDYIYLKLKHWLGVKSEALVILSKRGCNLELVDYIGLSRRITESVDAVKIWAMTQGAEQLVAWASPGLSNLLNTTSPQQVSIAAHLAVDWKESVLDEVRIQEAQWWWLGGDTDFQ
jgi:hypothetical protein